MRASSTARAGAWGWGGGTPWISALSAAMMAAPPEVAMTATPRAFGGGALAKKQAVSMSASMFSTDTTPARSNAAR